MKPAVVFFLVGFRLVVFTLLHGASASIVQVIALTLCGGIFTWGLVAWVSERATPRAARILADDPGVRPQTFGAPAIAPGLAALLGGLNLTWMAGELAIIAAVSGPGVQAPLPVFWQAAALLTAWLARLAAALTLGLTLLLAFDRAKRHWEARKRCLIVALGAWMALGLGWYWGALP